MVYLFRIGCEGSIGWWNKFFGVPFSLCYPKPYLFDKLKRIIVRFNSKAKPMRVLTVFAFCLVQF